MKHFTLSLKMLLLALCVVGGVSSAWADSYTITFKTGSGDGTSASTSTACSDIVSEGSSYLSGNLATATKVYYSGSDGLKLGTSSAAGTIKMNLASNVTPTSIVVNAKLYNSSKAATLKVNGSATQNITSSFSDLTFNITSEISYIELASSKYCWIKSITVNYSSSSIATPTFSVAAGTYNEVQSVELSCTTDGASIYYTTDGSTPTTSSTSYTSAISVSGTTTIKAIAVKGEDISDVASATYTLQVAAPTFSIDTGVYNEAQSVELSCTTAGSSIYYTTDGSTPTVSSTPYTGAISISSTTTVKAIAVKSNWEASDVASATYTLIIIVDNTPNTNYFVKVTDATTLAAGDNIILVNEDANVAMSTTQNTNNRGQADVSITSEVINTISRNGQKLVLQGEADAWNFYTGSGFLYAVKGNNYLKTNTTYSDASNAAISISGGNAIIKFTPNTEERFLRYNESSDIFSCYTATSSVTGTVQIYKEVPFPIGSSLYATYNASKAVSFPTGITAYIVSAVGDDNVTLTEVESVPANTPVVLKATEAGSYSFTAVTSTDAVETNYLKVSDGSKQGGDDVFALANKDGEVGFYAVSSSVTIPAGKCYIDGTANAKSRLSFSFEGEDATGIKAIAMPAQADGVYYNLNGQRVVNPVKGIYILNGKKILVK